MLNRYDVWAKDHCDAMDESRSKLFYPELHKEPFDDLFAVLKERIGKNYVYLSRNQNGVYLVQTLHLQARSLETLNF